MIHYSGNGWSPGSMTTEHDCEREQVDARREQVDRFGAEMSIEAQRLNDLACGAQREAFMWGRIARELIAMQRTCRAYIDPENTLSLKQPTVLMKAILRQAAKVLTGLADGAAWQRRRCEVRANRFQELRTSLEVGR